jgi:hypothetical protein
VTTTTTTTEYVLVEGEWVLGEPVVDNDVETFAPTAEQLASLGAECIAGSETIKPKPDKKTAADKAPVVLGTQAAVPTAVAAGYAGEPPATSSAMQVLAQLMTAGGLLLLLAGGWIGFGRRESGAHQI